MPYKRKAGREIPARLMRCDSHRGKRVRSSSATQLEWPTLICRSSEWPSEIVPEAEAKHARVQRRGDFFERRGRRVGRANSRRHARVQDVEDVEHRRDLAELAELERLVEAQVKDRHAGVAVCIDRLNPN